MLHILLTHTNSSNTASRVQSNLNLIKILAQLGLLTNVPMLPTKLISLLFKSPASQLISVSMNETRAVWEHELTIDFTNEGWTGAIDRTNTSAAWA